MSVNTDPRPGSPGDQASPVAKASTDAVPEPVDEGSLECWDNEGGHDRKGPAGRPGQ